MKCVTLITQLLPFVVGVFSLQAFFKQPLLLFGPVGPDREWHIDSLLRSVVSELIFHHVILTLWV